MSIQTNPPVSSFAFDRKGRVRRTSRGAEIPMHYKGPNTAAYKEAFIASHQWGEAHPDFEDSFLNSIDESPIADSPEEQGMVELILNYGPLESSSAGTLGRMNHGDWTLETDCGTVEQPKEVAPPGYLAIGGNTQETWTAMGDEGRDEWMEGAQGWLQPNIIATRTDAVDFGKSKTISESEAFGQVGKLLTATSMASWGITGATLNRWLFTGKRISINGQAKIITRTAQGVPTQWNNAVYEGDASEIAEN